MSEVKTDPIKIAVGHDSYDCFSDQHSIADIVRYAMKQGNYETLNDLVGEMQFLEVPQ